MLVTHAVQLQALVNMLPNDQCTTCERLYLRAAPVQLWYNMAVKCSYRLLNAS